MANISWTLELPVTLRLEGLSSQPQSNVIRTSMDAGAKKARRRYTARTVIFSGKQRFDEAELAVFENKKGRELFDHMETIIKKTGDQYLSDEKIAEKDTDYLYFLWCGPNSPFFDKHKMATWERYLITGTVDKNDFKNTEID